MAQNYYESFTKKLEEIFMMDHAELDFGIYRIMNQKRNDIQRFLNLELLPQVKQVLEVNNADANNAKNRMAEIKASVGGNIGVLPKGTPMRDEYDRLEAQLAQYADTESMQAEVFSHLVTFFSRYYDNGDFISKRRYKDNTYAIPYNGEEVKLHWANSDQYYIKSSEYFRDYSFVLPTSRRKVHFVLKDASTEQNNNKTAKNMERRFALYKPETEGEPFYEVNGDELNIFFTYELMPKGTKQNDLMAEALDSIKEIVPLDFSELLTVKSPTDKNANRTLLEKHLTDYTAKNSFDYFIHKDLGGFLRRELDFYIKNEVLHIDDLDVQLINSQLTIVRAIKQVGEKIIRMLAQLEDFQKKLWLKKKFVVQSDYCITIDRVPRKLCHEILANDRQREEWVRLFAIDEIKGDMVTEAYSVPLTMEFLEQNPFLVLDTAFFSKQFKHKLVASMENIDRDCNGLLINSENFQALELLQEKYANAIGGVYNDPPYNTKKNEFIYKDSMKHSSWVTMMNDRISLIRRLMTKEGGIMVSCDENEVNNLRSLMYKLFGEDNYLSDIIWEGSSKNDQKYLSISHEYILTALKDKAYLDSTEIRWTERKQGLEKIYDAFEKIRAKHPNDFKKQEEEIKKWFKALPNDEPAKKQKHYCAVERRGLYFPDNISKPENGYYYDVFHPITGKPCKKPKGGWRFIESTMNEQLADDRIHFGSDETTVPCRKSFLKETEYQSPSTVIYLDNRVSTAFMKDLFNDKKIFDNPKYYLLIARLLKMMGNNECVYLDGFAGSGTTAHSVINLNREDKGNRKYILCEMAEYFKKVTKPRIEKVIYSPDWKDGKPVSRQGISQCFKYMRLEQYEDTLNNLKIKEQQTTADFNDGSGFKESYMLEYMLDVETRDSLLNLKMFENPFAMTLKTTKDNELVETEVDMVETFNYLIGLNVETEDWYSDENICVVQGHTHRDNLHTLVIWRNCKVIDNEKLCRFFERMDFRTRDSEFDLIYVNGDNTLPNLRRDEENWKVVLTEEEFQKRMFEKE
ncbi:MAG: site-specific DNA-methyltransferase [Bacteroidales bacterium]|nr:site-specific DNA-methyltransferase [Bacteroidales bacterium]